MSWAEEDAMNAGVKRRAGFQVTYQRWQFARRGFRTIVWRRDPKLALALLEHVCGEEGAGDRMEAPQ